MDGRTGRAGRTLAHALPHTDTVLPMTRLPNEDITMYVKPTERPRVGDIVQIIEGAIGTRATLCEEEECPLNTGRVVVLGEHTRETHTLWSREIEAHRRGSASADEVLRRCEVVVTSKRRRSGWATATVTSLTRPTPAPAPGGAAA